MSKFIQDGTGVVVSVADEKDDRFKDGWKRADAPPEVKRNRSRKSEQE